MRRDPRAGFTLVEIMVVVLMLAILIGIAVPQYLKTVENSKASQATTMLQEIGIANRMREVDGLAKLYGEIDNDCNANTACDAASNDPCHLVFCKLVASRDWEAMPYKPVACDGTTTTECCAAGSVACVSRRSGASPGTDSAPYKDWIYRMSGVGVISAINVNAGEPPPAP